MTQELRVHQSEPRRAAGAQHLRARRTPVFTPFDELQRLFDELMPNPALRLSRAPDARSMLEGQARVPSIDLLERDNEILLRAEVPGIAKDDLDISVDENSVTLRGSVAREEQEGEGQYYRCEIARGEFARSLPLPAPIDADGVKASLKDGVLELIMPKLEVNKRRKIKVS